MIGSRKYAFFLIILLALSEGYLFLGDKTNTSIAILILISFVLSLIYGFYIETRRENFQPLSFLIFLFYAYDIFSLLSSFITGYVATSFSFKNNFILESLSLYYNPLFPAIFIPIIFIYISHRNGKLKEAIAPFLITTILIGTGLSFLLNSTSDSDISEKAISVLQIIFFLLPNAVLFTMVMVYKLYQLARFYLQYREDKKSKNESI